MKIDIISKKNKIIEINVCTMHITLGITPKLKNSQRKVRKGAVQVIARNSTSESTAFESLVIATAEINMPLGYTNIHHHVCPPQPRMPSIVFGASLEREKNAPQCCSRP